MDFYHSVKIARKKRKNEMSRCKKHDFYSMGSFGKYTRSGGRGFYMGSQEHFKCSHCGAEKKVFADRRYKS